MNRDGRLRRTLLIDFQPGMTAARPGKGADGYPPFNIERLSDPQGAGHGDRVRITLAVAGFASDELDVTTENNRLTITGVQANDTNRDYLYRGIAARQFRKAFALADGVEVDRARLQKGLLSIDLKGRAPERTVRTIDISVAD